MSLNLTREQILARFPRATETFIKLNLSVGSAAAPAVMECRFPVKPVAKAQADRGNAETFHVRVTAYRFRLLDEDRICEVAIVDCLRYAGIIPNDSPDLTHIETLQEKISKKAGQKERVLVEVFRGSPE